MQAVTMRPLGASGGTLGSSDTSSIGEGFELDHGFVQAFLKSFLMVRIMQMMPPLEVQTKQEFKDLSHAKCNHFDMLPQAQLQFPRHRLPCG